MRPILTHAGAATFHPDWVVSASAFPPDQNPKRRSSAMLKPTARAQAASTTRDDRCRAIGAGADSPPVMRRLADLRARSAWTLARREDGVQDPRAAVRAPAIRSARPAAAVRRRHGVPRAAAIWSRTGGSSVCALSTISTAPALIGGSPSKESIAWLRSTSRAATPTRWPTRLWSRPRPRRSPGGCATAVRIPSQTGRRSNAVNVLSSVCSAQRADTARSGWHCLVAGHDGHALARARFPPSSAWSSTRMCGSTRRTTAVWSSGTCGADGGGA